LNISLLRVVAVVVELFLVVAVPGGLEPERDLLSLLELLIPLQWALVVVAFQTLQAALAIILYLAQLLPQAVVVEQELLMA
jgi:hypothetical protein